MQQNMQGNQPQSQTPIGVMKQPPQMVSTKDSLYLKDMLSWNLLAMKKAHFFAAQCQDQQVVQALNKYGQMHQRHYNTVLAHLNPAQQNQQFQ
nr:hypothetical protein [Bacillus cihuensis]